ncbi:AAA family ATPase [Pseudonocardia saturnea]
MTTPLPRAVAPVGLDIKQRYLAVRDLVVGREEQVRSVLAVLAAGRDLLLEGPPGTSKSTILRAITGHYGIPLVFVEGNADLTPQKLIGYHDPAQVMRHGYRPEDFVAGPLPDAMRRGGFLYIEEFNRVPEDTLNALLTAMAERELTVPRVGRIAALDSFRLVAAMNPFDNVGTTRVSVSVYDRLCRLAVGYQSAAEEREIVALRSARAPDDTETDVVAFAVDLVRATRSHPDLRTGSSVRGAIDLVLVARQLAEMHGVPFARPRADSVLREAACLALSSKIAVIDVAERTPEEVIVELVSERLR